MVTADTKNLSHFADGVDDDHPLYVEVVVNDQGKVVVFHDRAFHTDVNWFECDLDKRRFHFVFEGGDMIDAGITVNEGMAKHMQNSHQVLLVHMDNDSGEAVNGNYHPLILQKI